MIKKFIDMLDNSPSSFNATDTIVKDLIKNGYEKIDVDTKIKKGHKYYVTKNESSILAFNIPKKLERPGFNIVASHLDCPSFKIKPNPTLKDDNYSRVNVEGYGGMIMSTWLDRPLSVCGRIIYKKDNAIEIKIVKIDQPFLMIPNVAIHMNREVNSGYKFNVKNDMIPFYGTDEKFSFEENVAHYLGLDAKKIIGYDLFLFPTLNSYVWGRNKEFLTSFHLDNLCCAFGSYLAFLNNFKDDVINVYASFDNEEVGSLTQQGADSNFFYDYLQKIANDLDFEYLSLIENSFMVSADNAHSLHPNHPEYSDANNKCFLNKGVVVKFNANQKYTSDGLSFAIFKEIFDKKKLNVQIFTNRSDLKGGSTLGNLSNRHVSLITIDIGLPQLAMHSSMETCGLNDVLDLIEGLKAFYQTKIIKNGLDVEIK